MTNLANYTNTMNEVVTVLTNNNYVVVGNTVSKQLAVLSCIAEYILMAQQKGSNYNATKWFKDTVNNFTVAEQLEYAGIQPV